MGRKKGNGEGSIYRYKSGWRGQITLGDKRISVSGKTKAEVVDKLAEKRVAYNKGAMVDTSNITVEEWVNFWITKKCEPKLAEQSLIRLRIMFDNHLIPELGKYKLQDLNKALLEESYAKIFQKKTGKNYKEPTYSHSTVNSLSVRFKKCLQYAVDEGILSKNPHNGVELHKLRPPKKVEAYNLADHKKIVEFTKNGKQIYKIFYLLISTGMRFGEAAALTWDDVDFKEKSLNINKTAVSIHGSMSIQHHPKTEAGERVIYVSKNVVDWLKHIKSEQDPELNYMNLVMPNNNYNITNSANAVAHWRKACAILDIKYSGMHALRHTWATRALEKGIDVKTVSGMLGHKNIITTMNIYQDVLADQKKKAASKMDDLF